MALGLKRNCRIQKAWEPVVGNTSTPPRAARAARAAAGRFSFRGNRYAEELIHGLIKKRPNGVIHARAFVRSGRSGRSGHGQNSPDSKTRLLLDALVLKAVLAAHFLALASAFFLLGSMI